MTQPPHELTPVPSGETTDALLRASHLETIRGLKKQPLRIRFDSKARPCNGMDNPMKQAQQAHWRHRTK